MSHPTDETPNPVSNPDGHAEPEPAPAPAEAASAARLRGRGTDPGRRPRGRAAGAGPGPSRRPSRARTRAGRRGRTPSPRRAGEAGGQGRRRRPPATAARRRPPRAAADDDDDEQPALVWYVLKVQSSREDTIRDALERRVKIQGLQRFFGRIVVPTEKITEIRNNKKRIVERKTYPGYIMVEMELNEKTWFVVRETPGVGDFVGAHGTPTKMTETEVNQMLGQETAKTEEAPQVRIDVERGDRVKIKDGPFENFEGSVEEVIEARGLVKVMLIIFNRPTPVDLEYWQVERI